MTYVNQHVSVSRLRLYEECPRAFFFRYVEKDPNPIPEDTDAADFGKILHSALEGFYRDVIETEYEGPISESALLAHYRAAWRTVEGRGKDAKLPSTMGADVFAEGADILRLYARSHPHVSHLTVLGVEDEVHLRVGRFDLLGYVDRVEKVDDTTVRIIDYKSNRKLYTRTDLVSDLQMSTYGAVAYERFPWATSVEFSFEMLRFNTVQRSTRTKQQIADAVVYLTLLAERTEIDTTWEAKLNSNCSYCAGQRRCDLFQRALAGGHEVAKAAKGDFDAIVKERESIAKVARSAYARQKRLDDVIRAKIEKDGPLQVGMTSCKLSPVHSVEYPTEATLEAVARVTKLPEHELRDRLCTIDSTMLDSFLKEQAESLSPGQLKYLEISVDAVKTQVVKSQRIDIRTAKGEPPPTALHVPPQLMDETPVASFIPVQLQQNDVGDEE